MTVPDLTALAHAAAACLAGIADPGSKPRIGLYGTGFLGTWAADWLCNHGFDLVCCFDGNAERVGGSLRGRPVLGPDAVKDAGVELVLISARHAVAAVKKRLADCPVPAISFDAFYLARHFSSFANVHERLGDERSRLVLRAVMTAMLSGRADSLHAVFEKDQYFALPAFCGTEPEIYIDAGAYVGDSVERFIWTHYGVFREIHAFEPGIRQFGALQERATRLIKEWVLQPEKVVLSRTALGRQDAIATAGTRSGQLQSLSLAAPAEDTAGTINIVSLDTYLDGRPATFLKADVEGMEMALLDGARETIRRHQPKIAICVYHYPSDIPAITGLLLELVPQYRFALRHHSPRLLETVLYAWIDHYDQ